MLTYFCVKLTTYTLDDIFHGMVYHVSSLEDFILVEQLSGLMHGLMYERSHC